MKEYFYLRVSTQSKGENAEKQREQTFERQKGILERCGYVLTPDNTFAERISGKTKNDERKEFERLLSVLVPGDWVIFSETSRFSRSYINGMEMLDELIYNKKVNVKFVSNGIELCANGKFNPYVWFTISQMLLADELQRRVISFNTSNGLKAKKESGVKLGRPRSSDELKDDVLKLHDRGLNGVEIASMVNISRSTISRIIKRERGGEN